MWAGLCYSPRIQDPSYSPKVTKESCDTKPIWAPKSEPPDNSCEALHRLLKNLVFQINTPLLDARYWEKLQSTKNQIGRTAFSDFTPYSETGTNISRWICLRHIGLVQSYNIQNQIQPNKIFFRATNDFDYVDSSEQSISSSQSSLIFRNS